MKRMDASMQWLTTWTEPLELFSLAGGDSNHHSLFEKQQGQFQLPWNTSLSALVLHWGIYPKEMIACVHTEVTTWKFTAATLVRAKCWKQPKGPPKGERINKSWSTHMMGICSATNGSQRLTKPSQMKLRITLLSGRSQKMKSPCCVNPFISNSRKRKSNLLSQKADFTVWAQEAGSSDWEKAGGTLWERQMLCPDCEGGL